MSQITKAECVFLHGHFQTFCILQGLFEQLTIF